MSLSDLRKIVQGGDVPILDDVSVGDLVAALREEGVGEVVQSFTMQQRVTVALSGDAEPGRYLVVRIDGEET